MGFGSGVEVFSARKGECVGKCRCKRGGKGVAEVMREESEAEARGAASVLAFGRAGNGSGSGGLETRDSKTGEDLSCERLSLNLSDLRAG